MSLHADFMAAVHAAATAANEERCARGFHHQPHDTTTGHCPGHTTHTLTPDQTKRLADTVRKEIRR